MVVIISYAHATTLDRHAPAIIILALLACLPIAVSFAVLPSSSIAVVSTTMNMVAASADDSITNTAVAAAISSTNTLGPRVLRKLVQKASIQNIHTHTLDLGGIVWLEHVNLVVGDMSTATKFYIDFLGMTSEREANPKSNHFNLGQQQFHLAAVETKNAEQQDWPQRVTGSIGLCVPSLSRIRERLDRAQSELRGTLFSVVEEDTNTMTATCPWGNVIHLYDVLIDEEYCPSSSKGAGSSQQKMVVQHEEGGVYGPHRMAVRGNPGIRFVEIACAVGTIDAIAEFYETLLGCQVTRRTTTEEDPSSNDANEMQVAIVSVGPGVHIVFAEQKNLTRECMKLMEGVHICIYIPNFQRSYNTLHERSLIWTNPRFTHLDSCDTLPEAAASRTFRFKDIIDLRTGEKILELEHETRPMLHGQYMKVPPYFPISN